jgi:hypothetical protein
MDNLLAGTLILLARRFACWVVVQRRFAFQLVEIIPGSSRSPFGIVRSMIGFPSEWVIAFSPEP